MTTASEHVEEYIHDDMNYFADIDQVDTSSHKVNAPVRRRPSRTAVDHTEQAKEDYDSIYLSKNSDRTIKLYAFKYGKFNGILTLTKIAKVNEHSDVNNLNNLILLY